jgi:hypothetical protein
VNRLHQPSECGISRSRLPPPTAANPELL